LRALLRPTGWPSVPWSGLEAGTIGPDEENLADAVCAVVLSLHRPDALAGDATAAPPRLAGTPIASIAARWGLGNHAHFTRIFRETYGQTPTATRDGAYLTRASA
jgi:AraC-like DNA-binding protein